jgi:Arc/MetJ-type ribon-helix-helix transcriptional regulator
VPSAAGAAKRQPQPSATVRPMHTIEITLCDQLQLFVDEQVAVNRHSSASDYVARLVIRDKEAQHLETPPPEGADALPVRATGDANFDEPHLRLPGADH